jgi:hypothetical protein
MSVLISESRQPFTTWLLLELMMEGRCERSALGRACVSALPRLGKRHAADLALVETRVRLRPLFRACAGRIHYPFAPLFVETTADIRRGRERDWSGIVRRNWKLVEKKGYTYELSDRAEHLETFLERYWKPLVRHTHGPAAIVFDEYSSVRSARDRLPPGWVLVRVFLDDQWVSGMLANRDPATNGLRLLEVGVRDGDDELRKAGAQWAAYWASIQALRERGQDRLSMMWAPPFFTSNSLRLKLGFRPAVSPPDYPYGLHLVPLRDTPALRGFFHNNPFFELRDGRLAVREVVCDAPRPGPGAPDWLWGLLPATERRRTPLSELLPQPS